MRRAPFPALAPGGESLQRRPAEPAALRERMAALYGVDTACVLPIRDAIHGIELAFRRAARKGERGFSGFVNDDINRLAAIYGFGARADARLRVAASPGLERALDAETAREAAASADLLVIDESLIEFADAASLAPLAAATANMLVLRSLSFAYGLAGAPCGAAIGAPTLIAELDALLEPYPLPTPTQRLALAALDPSRLALTQRRIAEAKQARSDLAQALAAAPGVEAVSVCAGPHVLLTPKADAAPPALRAFDLDAETLADGRLLIAVGEAETVRRACAAFGVGADARPPRRATVVRDTKETRIVAAVDLDASAPVRIATGLAFYDHMLEQIAAHGGFSLDLSCDGDLEVDAHHTVEDCAIAIGQALSQALGERRGIGRYGFVAPMDEAQANVAIDLSGRPQLAFKARFKAPLLGAYPTEMTEHVFASLSQHLGAAIHVSVTGDNDHHMTEACFKGFGRALRQAIAAQGGGVPSTKGVL